MRGQMGDLPRTLLRPFSTERGLTGNVGINFLARPVAIGQGVMVLD